MSSMSTFVSLWLLLLFGKICKLPNKSRIVSTTIKSDQIVLISILNHPRRFGFCEQPNKKIITTTTVENYFRSSKFL